MMSWIRSADRRRPMSGIAHFLAKYNAECYGDSGALCMLIE